MAKFIYDGLITDPKDPVYNREWTVTFSPTFSPTSKKNSKDSSQEKTPPKTPELTTQIETEGEGVPQTQNLEPQAIEETKPEIELTNSEKYFAVHGRFPKIPPKVGVTQDYKQAFKWYTKSAEQGQAEAQYNLGYMYQNGESVTQDYKQAFKWYTKSAEQGYADAQLNLGFMYKYGESVIQDYVVAYAWYSVSEANGSELGAEFRDKILKLLTPSQIEKGQELARELFEKYGK